MQQGLSHNITASYIVSKCFIDLFGVTNACCFILKKTLNAFPLYSVESKVSVKLFTHMLDQAMRLDNKPAQVKMVRNGSYKDKMQKCIL